MDYRVEDVTGPCNGVKGAVDVYDPPLEARVPRLDRCCLKQKVGYSRDTAPKNNHFSLKTRIDHSRVARALTHTFFFQTEIACLAVITGETGDSWHSSCLNGKAKLGNLNRLTNDS